MIMIGLEVRDCKKSDTCHERFDHALNRETDMICGNSILLNSTVRGTEVTCGALCDTLKVFTDDVRNYVFEKNRVMYCISVWGDVSGSSFQCFGFGVYSSPQYSLDCRREPQTGFGVLWCIARKNATFG